MRICKDCPVMSEPNTAAVIFPPYQERCPWTGAVSASGKKVAALRDNDGVDPKELLKPLAAHTHFFDHEVSIAREKMWRR